MKIIDLHCDTISHLCGKGGSLLENESQYDIKRALQAHVSLQFFALFTKPAESNTCLREILKQTDKFWSEINNNRPYLYPATSSNEILNPEHGDKLGCLLHLEGAECIGTDSEILRVLYMCGLRSMGLTWNNRNLLADGGGEGSNAGGLSRKGREIVQEMDQLGIILDLAHISEAAYYEAVELYSRPVFVTHANARSLCPHWRNLSDSQLRTLGDQGGVVGITQVSDFVKENGATIDDMLNHIVYIADLIGVEHVALGSDFDGADDMVLGDVGQYAQLPLLLESKGFTHLEAENILGGNALRVIKQII